ncbi:hypothetical protein [Microviridae sp.]|nr:hypothetical protein [Microviridae sp.]
MIFCKKSKLAAVETTLKLLAGYHAVPLDNEAFLKQYRHVFALLNILKGT